jgi:purine-binding chemotaxis protein CheW
MTAKEILRARARALARPAVQSRPAGQTVEVVEFRLASERYAIEQTFVREVLPLKELTPLPCTPPFLRGIVNVRGQILSVINIKNFFDLPETGLIDVHMILIVHSQGIELGIEADAVTGAREIPLASVQPSLPTLTGIRAQYLKGITDDHVVILDAARILGDPKILVDDEVHSSSTRMEKTP